MSKEEFLQSLVEFAVSHCLGRSAIENWLCASGENRLEAGYQFYPEARGWTPDVMADAIINDLSAYMQKVSENMFE